MHPPSISCPKSFAMEVTDDLPTGSTSRRAQPDPKSHLINVQPLKRTEMQVSLSVNRNMSLSCLLIFLAVIRLRFGHRRGWWHLELIPTEAWFMSFPHRLPMAYTVLFSKAWAQLSASLAPFLVARAPTHSATFNKVWRIHAQYPFDTNLISHAFF